MTVLYSATTRAFYDTDIGYKSLPEDCVEITREEHIQFMVDQSNGLSIVPDPEGRPTAVRVVTQKGPVQTGE